MTTIESILKKLDELNNKYEELKKMGVSGKLDNQIYVKRNENIKPATYCKVSYDSNGLIRKGMDLESSDIPNLSIDKIDNLRKRLDEKVSQNDIKRLMNDINKLSTKGDIAGTGCKVNYDSRGTIVSTTDLTVDDIPLIPMNKVDGLEELIGILKSSNKIDESSSHNILMAPSTGCKVSYDKYGHVTSSSNLSMSDIPNELITRLNTMETKMASFSLQSSIESINKKISNKLDSNDRINPGDFYKVNVDSKGLVTGGKSRLEINDLPELTISNIRDLDNQLRNKVDAQQLTDINNTISTLSNSLSKVSDIMKLKTIIENKSDKSYVDSLDLQISSIQQIIDNILNKLPSDMILEEIEKIEESLSTIDGRLAVLERRVFN